MSYEIRWKQRFSNFKKATAQLTEFIEKGDLNKFEVQGIIQCFEYTFELAWKTMKDYLNQEGLDVRTPRETIKTAFQIKLVNEGHIWIDALEKHSLLAHTYDEKRAIEAEQLIKTKYYKAILHLNTKLEELL